MRQTRSDRMHSPAACLSSATGLAAATALAVALGSAPASACGYPCGYGYDTAYYAPPAYAYAPPVAVYAAPPVYSYSYYGPAYPPVYNYYTTRVNIFRGPRWNYSAAYYTSPAAYGGGCRRVRVSPCARARAYVRPYRSFYLGPIIPVSRRW
jgi:hypothetical protein